MKIFSLKLQHKNSYYEVLRVCLPLVLSLSATTIMEFTDRVFLANYSIDALSAALPAGITSFVFMAFLGGVGGYAGVFIAQYTGRGEHRKVGIALWQGIYFTIISGILLWLIAVFLSTPLFSLAGHPPEVQRLEEVYFSILCKGAILHVGMATLSTFFSGRGLTRPVMIITFIGVFINIPLDYALIYGRWGMPELGIAGAAIATVVGWAVNVVLLVVLIFTRQNNQHFGVFSNNGFNRDIFSRLMRYGIPGSLQFTLDILAFTFFILLVGRIGKTELAATNIVLSINALAFMPSMGVSQGVSVLVGQALGSKKPRTAANSVSSASHLLIGYILIIDLLFIFAPQLVLEPFLSTQRDPAGHAELLRISTTLLQIVAAYLFFDALYMVVSGALRGAGDTRFMMLAISVVSPICLILPVYFGVSYFSMTVEEAWLCILLFITVLFTLSALRYRNGAWKRMLVIEDTDP